MRPTFRTPPHGPRPILWTVPAAILVVGLMVVPASTVAAGPASPSTSVLSANSTTWAFGNVTPAPVSSYGPGGGYAANATYGFVTNVTATNTSATTVEVTVQQTVGIALSLSFCRPSCGSASRVISQFSYHAWETEDTWTNLTNTANVTQTFGINGTSLTEPALGIINSSAQIRAYVSESATDARYTVMNRTQVSSVSAEYWFSANSTVGFTSPLGLLPIGPVAARDAWVSVSTYVGQADWTAHWTLNLTGMRGGTTTIHDALSNTVGPATGIVTVQGRAALSSLRVGATNLVQVGYQLNGPFEVAPGLALRWALPDGLGMGLPRTSTWSQHAAVLADASVSALDTLPSPQSPFGLRSAEVTFSLAVLDANNSVNDTVPQSNVSGAPMTSSQAGDTAACLQQADVCSTTIGLGGNAGASGDTTLVLAAVSLVVLGALIATVAVARQRRIPSDRYPNAGLYPPGQAIEPPGAGRPNERNGQPTRDDSADDPLDRLW